MSTYDEYVAHMKGLAAPSRVPDHMPVMYAVALGQPIARVFVLDDILRVVFAGGDKLFIWDGDDQCCEHRYMTTDDELDTFVGAKLVGIEVVDGPDIPFEDGVHEQTFVKLETTMGTITLVTHNEHNGYYGGFDVESRWED
jgi:hypothetical protein